MIRCAKPFQEQHIHVRIPCCAVVGCAVLGWAVLLPSYWCVARWPVAMHSRARRRAEAVGAKPKLHASVPFTSPPAAAAAAAAAVLLPVQAPMVMVVGDWWQRTLVGDWWPRTLCRRPSSRRSRLRQQQLLSVATQSSMCLCRRLAWIFVMED